MAGSHAHVPTSDVLGEFERELAQVPFDGAVPAPGRGPSPTLKAARRAERDLELACAGDARLQERVDALRYSLGEHSDRMASQYTGPMVGWRRALRMGRVAFLDVLREYQLEPDPTRSRKLGPRQDYRPESAVLGCYYGIALAFATRYAWNLVRAGYARLPRRRTGKGRPRVPLPPLAVRAFREEHARWEQAARAEGMQLAVWVRETLHARANRQLGPPTEPLPSHRPWHGPAAGDATLLARP